MSKAKPPAKPAAPRLKLFALMEWDKWGQRIRAEILTDLKLKAVSLFRVAGLDAIKDHVFEISAGDHYDRYKPHQVRRLKYSHDPH